MQMYQYEKQQHMAICKKFCTLGGWGVVVVVVVVLFSDSAYQD
jgi:FtsH-binding integral membrane protein